MPANNFIGGGADGVSCNGQVLVGGATRNDNKFEAFRWTAATGLVGIGYLPGGVRYSIARAVSWDGKYIAGYSESSRAITYEGFRWSEQRGFEVIGDLPGGTFVSIVTDMSADGGVIVGYSISSSGTEAFRWTEDDGIIGLGDFPGAGFDSRAFAVSGDGRVIYGTGVMAGLSGTLFRWTESEGMTPLPNPPDPETATPFISATNYDGTIVVGEYLGDAAIWEVGREPRYLRDVFEQEYGFDLSDWPYLIAARSISADGRTIAGYGQSVRGGEGWIAYLGPPPCWGDMNRDNAVNMLDLATLLLHFGDTLAGPTEGDMDRDADVDLTDLTLLLSAYGRVCE